MKIGPYRFVAMTAAYAAEIVVTWTYEGEHAIYNYANEAEHMLDREAWAYLPCWMRTMSWWGNCHWAILMRTTSRLRMPTTGIRR